MSNEALWTVKFLEKLYGAWLKFKIAAAITTVMEILADTVPVFAEVASE